MVSLTLVKLADFRAEGKDRQRNRPSRIREIFFFISVVSVCCSLSSLVKPRFFKNEISEKEDGDSDD